MSQHPESPETIASSEHPWRIVVNSIGDAGHGVVSALGSFSSLPDAHLAGLLYRAPSELIGDLPREAADQLNDLLRSAGLDSRVIGRDETFTPGGADYDAALVIKDVTRVTDVARVIIDILGIGPEEARDILCASPNMLVGKVSANVVADLKRRFEAVGAALDVSRPETALFDVFVGDCSRGERKKIERFISGMGVRVMKGGENAGPLPMAAAGLSKDRADHLWERLSKTPFPVRLLNRDFERFDLRLDQAAPGREMIDFLTSSTGMPEPIAEKIRGRAPVIIHQNIPFAEMEAHLDAIARMGGKASGHLLAFQTFSLVIEKVGDRDATAGLLRALGGFTREGAARAMGANRKPDGSLTSPQVRWLQWELKQVGTETGRVLR
ncbi:MAG: hypothetical protein GY859_00665 [Desulfobacterales bacterium]|nr:hypothetical protein [Desulfobacterales bacterium]